MLPQWTHSVSTGPSDIHHRNNSRPASLFITPRWRAQQQKTTNINSNPNSCRGSRASSGFAPAFVCVLLFFTPLRCEAAQDHRRTRVRTRAAVSKPDPALVDYSKWSQLKSIFNHPPLQRLLSPQRTWKDESQFDALIFRLMVNILERCVRGEGVFELLRFFFLFYFISLLVSLN